VDGDEYDLEAAWQSPWAGSATDTWGFQDLTPEIINSEEFGASISATRVIPACIGCSYYVSACQMRVHYIPSNSSATSTSATGITGTTGASATRGSTESIPLKTYPY
jgi:hypothetical protein